MLKKVYGILVNRICQDVSKKKIVDNDDTDDSYTRRHDYREGIQYTYIKDPKYSNIKKYIYKNIYNK